MLKSHNAAQLTNAQAGQKVTIAGWVHAIRDHGGVLFVDVRDRSGIVQTVFNEGLMLEQAKQLGLEDVIQIEGHVRLRPEGTQNLEIATGMIEVLSEKAVVLNKAKPSPFSIADKTSAASEETRLKYRFLDLRRAKMQEALGRRHQLALAVRQFLAQEGFWEIETPILTKSTPEGARDYLVPNRNQPGTFYALPQSPQIFKQILMVSGVEKYFQMARAFRDEDLRADRQPEHTQIDLEMSFVESADIFNLVERMLASVIQQTFNIKLATPFPRLTHEETMAQYQTDKPDLRYPRLMRQKLDALFAQSSFNVFINALTQGQSIYSLTLPERAAEVTRSELDRCVATAKEMGAKGLIWIKVNNGSLESPIERHLNAQEKKALLQHAKTGDLIFLCAENASLADQILTCLAKRLKEVCELKPITAHALAWVTDFPLLEYVAEEKRWQATHNPFTAPHKNDWPLLDTDPAKARSHQYDLVINGMEIGSGSIRNHQRAAQEKLFALMGYTKEEAQDRFGWLLEALEYGAPPHGGIALGLDRLTAIFLGEDSIREVIAFPKTQKGACLLCGAPTHVEERQLKELGLSIKLR